jgi:processive 1,2-diacylglycerol beta-glucosyltransferase
VFPILTVALLLFAAEVAVFWLVRSVVGRLSFRGASSQKRQSERRRVLVLTAPVGEGHVSAARALVAELEAEDAEIEVVLLDALDGIGRVLRVILHDLYRWQFGHAARFYGLLYRLLERFSVFLGMGRLTLVSFGSRPLLRMVEQVDPDIIVSTHPPVTCVLGHLRRRDRIRVPVVATITDLDGLCFWVHQGVDLHLVMHESCVERVERLAGPGSARCARPLIASAFHAVKTSAEARRALGLPETGAIAVVSGGGWGVGELEEAARSALAIEDLVVICLAGRNESTKRRLELAFASEPRVSVWGFTDRMSDLLAAADALVHSTGGVTVLEALARDCPVIAYGAPPGHARLTAKALVKQGLGLMARSPEELAASLRSVLERPAAVAKVVSSAPSSARLVLAANPRHAPEPTLPSRLLRRSMLACVALALPYWALSTDLPYALAAGPLDLAPLNVVSTSRAEVGLVIRAPPSMVPNLEAELETHHMHASFAFSTPIDHKLLGSIEQARDEPLPALGSGEPMSWLGTRGRLNDLCAALRVRGARYYLAPPELNFGQYLLAREQGTLPITGSRLGSGLLAPARGFLRGEVIVLDLGKRQTDAKMILDELLAAIARDHLSAVSTGQLLHSASASRKT